jgi:hypothetical protein
MSNIGCSSLLRRLWGASSQHYLLKMSLDARVRLDVCLTYISVTVAYASAIVSTKFERPHHGYSITLRKSSYGKRTC